MPNDNVQIDIRKLSLEQLKDQLVDFGEKAFRAKQIYEWLWQKSTVDFEEMTNLSKPLRTKLEAHFVINGIKEDTVQFSNDGTIKTRFRLHDDALIESVLIPVPLDKRFTVCVSTQVGCSLTCKFCATGKMKRVRNLDASEIYDQFFLVNKQALEHFGHPLTNIVYMGMGEPLYNFDHVRDALKLVMDGHGLALSKRRITLSTSGVVPMMARCGEEIGVNLAVSLHAVSKDVRDEIVPINRKYGLEELLQACADYPGASNARRITFEYVMLKDKNDSDEDAHELVRLLQQYDLPAKVNLIPFNPWEGANYVCSTPERVKAFSNIVFEGGISAPVRTPRGRDIDAACGQLKTSAEKKSRAQRDREAAEQSTADATIS